MSLLKIRDLYARVADGGKEILKGINLEIKPGEVHAIMGVNGSGKSTLANILGGKEGYEITGGSVQFEGKVFLAFQYPVELPGVLTTYFLRTALNAVRQHRGLPALNVREFNTLVKEKAKLLELGDELLQRAVNEGFSGGEKKRNEIFQMAVLEPKLAILDETDSGLDIDALQTVSEGVNKLRNSSTGMLVITHYQRLLNYIVPDVVHVMIDGRIVKSGGKELALELEDKGYTAFKDSIGA
jgi:Fe-S cluster assembly ATP-binding protein